MVISQTCTRCLYDNESIPNVTFDEDGVCNYCHIHDELDMRHPTGVEGRLKLERLASEIREAGKGKPYDVVVGVSGGRDSSYLLHLSCELGLRPIAAHYDNGWDTEIAKANINRMVEALQVPYFSYRVKQTEVDDLIRSFLMSHTQDAEAPTDLALVKILFHVARQHGIKYILDGHSFRTEGMAPLGWSYMDGRYVQSVHRECGNVPLETFPNLTLMDQIWAGIRGVKRPRPLYYVDYNAEEITKFLQDKYGFVWYGGHHLENTYTAFFDYYYRFNKLGYDGRLVELSALVRSGQMEREDALREIEKPNLDPEIQAQLLLEIKRRLKLTDDTFHYIMSREVARNTYRDWETYRKTFRRLKPLFWAMMKTGRIPETFYIKYVRGSK